jgi:hypothetical protein
MNIFLKLASVLLLQSLALQVPAHAQATPPINASLKEAASLIPVPGIQGAVKEMFNALKPMPGGGYMAKTTTGLPLQLYVFGDADKQAILVVVNSTIAMPKVFNNKAWKQLAGASFSDPIFSLSTVNFSLDAKDMPAEFKQVIANSYFNVSSLDFSNGFQTAAKIRLGGLMKNVIEVGMNVPVQDFTLRAGVVLPVPSDPAGRAALAASILADMKNLEKMAKDSPEFYAEFQLAPGKIIAAPLGMQALTLTDATISLNNKLTLGYKGNVMLQGGKKLITFFETPLNPAGAMDLLDFSFGMAAQDFTLEDYVNLATAFSTPKMPGGSFMKGIDKFEAQLRSVLKPLSVFKLRNPKKVADYKFGDKTKPFPPLESFNVLMLGPLASMDDGTGKTIKGPMMKLVGDATVLGQKLASMNAIMSANGLHAKASAGLSLKLGPLGKQGITMAANADIDQGRQLIGLRGNALGRILEANMNGASVSINSPATCLTPFALTAGLAIDPNMNFASVLDGLPGVNVDPGQIAGCFGAELEKAYKWVATTGASLGGYTAAAANQELNKIANAAAAEYNKAKQAARKAAESSINAVSKNYSAATDAVINTVGHTSKPSIDVKTMLFDRSVFDWDFYYDNNPDLVKKKTDLIAHWQNTGYKQRMRGSLEFDIQFYANRYPDAVKQMFSAEADSMTMHWLVYGIKEGRQGSADFHVAAYLARYPDLQKAFGADNYAAAFAHWLNTGKAEGRDGRPMTGAIPKGLSSGPKGVTGGRPN